LIAVFQPASARVLDLPASLMTRGIPGTIFLSRATLDAPVRIAEGLLHESLHHKYVDISIARQVLAVRPQTAPTIAAFWRRSPQGRAGEWNVDKALAAFHVYVHLCLLHVAILAASRRAISTPGSLESLQEAFGKALYLGHELERTALPALGADGKELLAWLQRSLWDVDAARVAAGLAN
jgi:hypothetical protein